MIGYRFFLSSAIFWRDNQGGILPLSPSFKLAGIDEASARRVLSESGSLFLRWESDFDGKESGVWWHIIKDSFDELAGLPKKTRYMVRKAAKLYETCSVAREEIIKNGYAVYKSAYERYETHEPMYSRDMFCDAVSKLPENTEFWAVFEKESQRMVGFSENYIEDGTCFYVTMWLEPESMTKFSGYLLFHEMELHYLKERGFKYISDGARSLSHDTNIHDFLESKFGFRKAYARLHVVYVPWLAMAVKLAFPFRHLLAAVPLGAFQKATILLKQEEI